MRKILDTAMKSNNAEVYLRAAVSTFSKLGWVKEYRLAYKMLSLHSDDEIEKLMHLRASL